MPSSSERPAHERAASGEKTLVFSRHSVIVCQHVVFLGGASPLRAVMTGTARLGKGVRQEAESEGSRCHKAGVVG
jgi:hypothetical protein